MHNLNKYYQKVSSIFHNNKTELIIFLLLSFVNTLFLFSVRYMPSLDGPQHIYNSRVLIELLKSNDFIGNYFEINNVIVGYWTGHALLGLFNYLFPAWIAEKILLFICLFFVPFSFRYLIKSINKNTNYIILLVIPFSQHFYFFAGYYSFTLAWIVFFLCIGYYIRISENITIKKAMMLCLLFLLGFLTHMLVFSLICLIMLALVIYKIITTINLKKMKASIISLIKPLLLLFLAILPALILAIIYSKHVFSIQFTQIQQSYSQSELYTALKNMQLLSGFAQPFEYPYNKYILYMLGLCGLYSVYYMISQFIKSKSFKSIRFQFFWFVIACSLFVLYLFFPNTFGTGSVSLRLLLFAWFIYLVWISLSKYPLIINLLCIILISWYTIKIGNLRGGFLEWLDVRVKDIEYVESFMEPNSSYIGINLSPHWNTLHLHMYCGANIPLLSHQNPQCWGHFPIVWKENRHSSTFGPYFPNEAPGHWHCGPNKQQNRIIDYILIIGHPALVYTNDFQELSNLLAEHYEFIVKSENNEVAVYKYKNYDLGKRIAKDIKYNLDFYSKIARELSWHPMPLQTYVYIQALKGFSMTPALFKDVIISNDEWLNHIKEKAEIRDITVKEVIYEDAMYMFNRVLQKEINNKPNE
jgi:hypothetical protein